LFVVLTDRCVRKEVPRKREKGFWYVYLCVGVFVRM